jgi:pimeloyl-ACP methyl ester carboxylesterase
MNEVKYREAERKLWESVGLVPSERYVTLPRVGTRARIQEVGEGDPVVFIHGGPNSGSTWAPLLEHLTGFRCLLVDRPGTGLSERYAVTKDNVNRYGDLFVGDVLDGLGLDSAHVVASSFGGMLAIRSDAAEPGRIERMVQMACPAFVPGMLTPRFMKGLGLGPLRWLINRLPPNARANDSIMRQIGHGASLDAGRIPQVFFDWYLDLQRYTDTMKNDTNMIASAMTFRGFDTSLTLSDEVLGAVEAPTRFLWGADDGFGGEDVARDVAGLMPNADVVIIPEAGHLPWLDFPIPVARQTAAWLTEVDAETPAS